MRPLFLLIISFLITCFTSAQQKQPTSNTKRSLPKPVGAVNDFGLFLTAQERETLENELIRYQEATTHAIVIATLKELPLEPGTKKKTTIEKIAFQYFNTWGIGDSIKNNGVLIMLSKNDRQVRIEVGKGLEKILTNNICARIIAQQIVPNFKKEAWFTGLNEAVQALEKELNKLKYSSNSKPKMQALRTRPAVINYLKLPPAQKQGSFEFIILPVAIFILFVAIFSRRKNTAAGSNTGTVYPDPHLSMMNDVNNNNQDLIQNDMIVAGAIDTMPTSGISSPSDDMSSGSFDSGSSFDGGSSDGGGSDGSW